jgi:hypothetical protein
MAIGPGPVTAFSRYTCRTGKSPHRQMPCENSALRCRHAPEFPPAVDATIVSGEISIPITIRRKPCMEYGKMMFGTTSNECGFDINIISYKEVKKTDIRITKILGRDLPTQLQREKMLVEIQKTNRINIIIGSSELGLPTFDIKKHSPEGMCLIRIKMFSYIFFYKLMDITLQLIVEIFSRAG